VRHKNTLNVFLKGVHHEVNLALPKFLSAGTEGRKGGLTSPMPGKIVKLFVQPGEEVKKGQPLIVMEAMKMEVHTPHTRTRTRTHTHNRTRSPHGRSHTHTHSTRSAARRTARSRASACRWTSSSSRTWLLFRSSERRTNEKRESYTSSSSYHTPTNFDFTRKSGLWRVSGSAAAGRTFSPCASASGCDWPPACLCVVCRVSCVGGVG
jgi:hypothetical protein